tara:strand:+ start:241 stop:645 length:405 start_codon:yes stop_codon:yes gene_type:complete
MYKSIILKQIIDSSDGVLSIAESENNIPFEIKRVYYIYDFKALESKRGFHAHKNLQQVIFAISGFFTLSLDDGEEKTNHLLNNPNNGILIDRKIWHTMEDFSDNCIILVLASDIFKESDYIRNYEDFMNYIKKA